MEKQQEKRLISAKTLQELKSPFLSLKKGNPAAQAFRPLPPEQFEKGHLVFVSKPDQLAQALHLKAPVIVALDKILQGEIEINNDHALFSTPSIQAAMVLILPLFDERQLLTEPHIHPSAVIHPTAHIEKDVKIGALCVIEAHAHIGARTLLHSQVVIGFGCEIGADCIIHSHATIGSDGYGYVTDPQTKINHKIPQIGKVVIEDHVEIGANCAIDRATLTETRIGSGTKLDNLVHIAHNVKIGKNCLLTAGTLVAGSAIIGDNCATGGGSQIKDHVTVTNDVMLGGRSGVMQDITEAGTYIGYPTEPLREGLKTLANLKYITQLKKQMGQVLKHLNLEDKD